MNAVLQYRVGVVSLDPLRRVGLQTILEESPGLEAQVRRLDEAMAADDLDAVLLDGGSVDGLLETVARFWREQQGTKLVVIGEGLDQDYVEAVMGAGAKGYLPSSASEAEIRMALEVVLDGSLWAPRKVLARLVETRRRGVGGGEGARIYTGVRCSDQMTDRELEVLHLLKDGRTNKQIAETMGVESVTVKAHMGRMLRKAGVKNRVALTLKAMAEDGGYPPAVSTAGSIG